MVLRILFHSFVGVVFGYLLGRFLEWFPNFNSALLEGLHALTGLNSVRTAAIFAAIGLIGGIISGILHEIFHATSHHRRWWKKDEW